MATWSRLSDFFVKLQSDVNLATVSLTPVEGQVIKPLDSVFKLTLQVLRRKVIEPAAMAPSAHKPFRPRDVCTEKTDQDESILSTFL